VSQSTDQLKLISLRAPALRVLLVVPVVLALVYSWFATRWYVGNLVAEFAPQIRDEQLPEETVEAMRLDAAQAAMRLSPGDPLPHRIIAGLKKASFAPDDLDEALRQYEEAVRLSPNDYRLWMDLGRTREQAGDAEGGERALRRSVELAPFYTYPRWYLGNLLLRNGRGDEAFSELRRAADSYPELRPQIFNAAWSFYNEDVDAINRAAGGSPAVRGELAVYVARRNRFEDALRLWGSLTPAEKKGQGAAGGQLISEALKTNRFRTALDISRDLITDALESPKAEQVLNAGFELDVEGTGTNIFGWKVTPITEAQVAVDPIHKHGGERSLRIVFKALKTFDFNNRISQLIVVEPGAQYRLEFYVRTETLKSGATPFVAVTNSVDGAVLKTSQPLPVGTNDWQAVAIDFQVPPGTEAITIRIFRGVCTTETICPISGIVWYDDFNLQRTGGSAAGGARGNGKTNAAEPAR